MAQIKKISTELQLLDKFLDTSGDAGTPGQVLSSTGAGINWVSGGSLPGGPYLPLSAGASYPLTGDLYLDDDSGATPSLYFKNEANNFWRYLMESGGDFSIKEGTSTRLTFQAGGNVGIGVTSPVAKLHVISTSTTEPTARIQSTGYTFLAGGTNDSYHALILRGTPAAATTYAVTAGDQMSFLEYGGDFRFYEKNSLNSGTLNEISRIHKTNSFFLSNVGIGTTSPDEKLVIYKPIGYASDSALYSAYAVNSTAVDNNKAFKWRTGITGNQTGHSLTFSTLARTESSYVERMRITGTGNVGIGNTSPDEKLEVSGSSATDYPSIKISNPGQTGRYMRIGMIDSVNHCIEANGGSTYLTFKTNATEKMRIEAGGNVGIGTTSPSQKLHLQNGILLVNSNTPVSTGIWMPDTNGNPSLRIVTDQSSVTNSSIVNAWGNSSNAGVMVGSTRNDGFAFQVRSGVTLTDGFANDTGNSRMVVLGNGNVGIGTTSPSAKLEVQNHATTTSIADIIIDGKRTDGNNGAVGELIFSNNGDTFATVAGFRDGADNKGSFQFQTQGALGFATRMTIATEGEIILNQYTLTQQAANSVYLLGVDSSGKVVQSTNIPSGTGGSAGPYLPLVGGDMTGQTTHGDNVYSYWGNSNDLQIGHDGSNTFIIDRGTGDLLNYYSNDWKVIKYGTAELSIWAQTDSFVKLFFDNSEKLTTTSTGITVANTIDFGGGNNNGIIEVSGSGDLIFKYKGSDPALTLDGGAVKTIVHNRLDALNIVNINNPSNNESILNIRDDDSSSNGHIAFENSSEVTGIVSSGTDFINFRAGDGVAITDSPMLTLLNNRIGINTTSPNSNVALDVDGRVLIKDSNGVADFYLGNYATANHFRFHTNNANTYFDMNCGNIYWRDGASTRYTFFPSTANMTVNGTITQNSDARVKENIVEIGDCISKVQAMKGVYYNRTDFNTETKKVGVIAQDVEAVLPELIIESPEDGLKSVAYSELTAVLINAIKEQQEIIEDLKTRITKLEN